MEQKQSSDLNGILQRFFFFPTQSLSAASVLYGQLAGTILFEKTYSQQYTHSAPSRGHLDSVGANEDCLNTMTASLSYATKCMVENISQELDLLLDSFN